MNGFPQDFPASYTQAQAPSYVQYAQGAPAPAAPSPPTAPSAPPGGSGPGDGRALADHERHEAQVARSLWAGFAALGTGIATLGLVLAWVASKNNEEHAELSHEIDETARLLSQDIDTVQRIAAEDLERYKTEHAARHAALAIEQTALRDDLYGRLGVAAPDAHTLLTRGASRYLTAGAPALGDSYGGSLLLPPASGRAFASSPPSVRVSSMPGVPFASSGAVSLKGPLSSGASIAVQHALEEALALGSTLGAMGMVVDAPPSTVAATAFPRSGLRSSRRETPEDTLRSEGMRSTTRPSRIRQASSRPEVNLGYVNLPEVPLPSTRRDGPRTQRLTARS
jgi:hypothetical protein